EENPPTGRTPEGKPPAGRSTEHPMEEPSEGKTICAKDRSKEATKPEHYRSETLQQDNTSNY
ncbi:8940_t:CDS:2, partial [Racocetra persica]